MARLHDEPRSGAPRTIDDALIEAVILWTLVRIPTKSPRRTDMKSPVDSETMSPTFPI
ncbi:hypothetical protein ACVI1I_006384 [Bradyrhizobium sp. USDA 4459]